MSYFGSTVGDFVATTNLTCSEYLSQARLSWDCSSNFAGRLIIQIRLILEQNFDSSKSKAIRSSLGNLNLAGLVRASQKDYLR